jgi:DNA modification methylase
MIFSKYLTEDARDTREVFSKNKLPTPRLIVTSPPYFDLKDYGGMSNQIGLGQKYKEYLHDVSFVFQQCYEISKKDASLWVIIDTFRKNGETVPLPFDLIAKMRDLYGEKTWHLRDIVIWRKTKNTPWHTEGRFRNHFEYILFFTKGENFVFNIDSTRETKNYKKWWLTYPERYNSNGKSITNVWEHTAPIRGWGHSRQNHMCSLPFGLLERIIEVGSRSGDIVFDPFGGSGSAIALASNMGRSGIAFDINREYKRLFKSEVVIAAKNYWTKRNKEKVEVMKAKKLFRIHNISLRKLKSASLLIQALWKKKKYRTILLTPKSSSNRLNIYLEIPSKKKVTIEKNVKAQKSNIVKTMKIELDVKILTSLGFKKKLKSRNKWFVYDYEKFYKQKSQCNNIMAYNENGVITNINFSPPIKK